MSEFKAFLKREFVVVIAGLAALVSCISVPAANYIDYVDTDVLGILFSLMLIIAGLRGNNVLSKLTGLIVRKAHIDSTRKAALAISVMTFFLSMFVTNDAALIALVPLTAIMFEEYPSLMIYAVVVQTVAANMGSMVTPFGNPQNLLIFSSYGITAPEFFRASLPTGILSLAIVIFLCMLMKKEPVSPAGEETELKNKRYIALYLILFALVLAAVFGFINILAAFASVCVVVIIIEPNRFAEADYGLLLTFVFFFIFVGNIRRIESVNSFAASFIEGKEFLASAVISQFISNVPAAVMVTGFTDNWKAVMLGTDIGGLGTPIASLASLISLRIYGGTENPRMLKFLEVFSAVNFTLLAAIGAFAYFTQL